MLAAIRGHVNVVKTLIKGKADVNMLTEVIVRCGERIAITPVVATLR